MWLTSTQPSFPTSFKNFSWRARCSEASTATLALGCGPGANATLYSHWVTCDVVQHPASKMVLAATTAAMQFFIIGSFMLGYGV